MCPYLCTSMYRSFLELNQSYFRTLIVLLIFFFVILCNILSIDSNSMSNKKDVIYTYQWAVEIKGGESVAKRIARNNGFIYLGEILPGFYHFKKPRLRRRSLRRDYLNRRTLTHDPNVVWSEQQVLLKRVKRDFVYVNDPEWSHMWYLNRASTSRPNSSPHRARARGINDYALFNEDNGPRMDMNIQPAWARGYAGQGVVVSILDDGLEIDHPDLKDNYDSFASCDVNNNDDNPEPRYRVISDTKSRIGGVRMLDGDVTDASESRALGHRMQHIDVYSASWGPEDDGKTVDGPGKLAQLAFINGIQLGRGGLGSIFVWASGNGGKVHDNCNCDGYTNSIYTLGVGAVSEHGRLPWYSEKCASTLAVAYSSGGRDERAVVTTDLNHTCTRLHSGTSASAPLAAGICAVTLSANRHLTWRDMQYLVVYTSRLNNLQAHDWHVNGVGRNVSHAFGYGLMDASAMIDLALKWVNVPSQRVCEVQSQLSGNSVLVRQGIRKTLALTTDGCAAAANRAGDPSQRVAYLEHVQAKVTVSSAQRGEIELWLTSPSRTVSKLLSRRPEDLNVAGFHDWPFMSVHFWGEPANGTWELTVFAAGASVSVHNWVLILYGISSPPPSNNHTSLTRRQVSEQPPPLASSDSQTQPPASTEQDHDNDASRSLPFAAPTSLTAEVDRSSDWRHFNLPPSHEFTSSPPAITTTFINPPPVDGPFTNFELPPLTLVVDEDKTGSSPQPVASASLGSRGKASGPSTSSCNTLATSITLLLTTVLHHLIHF